MLPARVAVLHGADSASSDLSKAVLLGLADLKIQKSTPAEIRLDQFLAGARKSTCAVIVGTAAPKDVVELNNADVPLIWLPHAPHHADWYRELEGLKIEFLAVISPCIGVLNGVPLRCPRLPLKLAAWGTAPSVRRLGGKPRAVIHYHSERHLYGGRAVEEALTEAGYSVVSDSALEYDLLVDIPHADPYARFLSTKAWAALWGGVPVIHGASAAESSELPTTVSCSSVDRLKAILAMVKAAPDSFERACQAAQKVAKRISWSYRLGPVMHMIFPHLQDRNVHQEEDPD